MFGSKLCESMVVIQRNACVTGFVLLWFVDSLESVSILMYVYISNGKTRTLALRHSKYVFVIRDVCVRSDERR